jgi:hypothetical protein
LPAAHGTWLPDRDRANGKPRLRTGIAACTGALPGDGASRPLVLTYRKRLPTFARVLEEPAGHAVRALTAKIELPAMMRFCTMGSYL